MFPVAMTIDVMTALFPGKKRKVLWHSLISLHFF